MKDKVKEAFPRPYAYAFNLFKS